MRPIGHTILRLEEVPSTNTLLLENPRHLENHGLVAIAAHQTAGRGRMERKWVSIPGMHLQFSLVIHPTLPSEEVPVYSLLSALAVAEAIEEHTAVTPSLKWPNDVLVNGRKVCGILLEGRSVRGDGHSGGHRLVIGIGINCNGSPGDFPPAVRGILTTLAHASGAPVDMEALFQGVLANFQALHGRLDGESRKELIDQWTRRALLEGQRVRFNSPEGVREGTPLGLTAEGYLIVETDGGERYVQISGDLEWLTLK
jgi:BirA family biotin operon repressor/biotin-[acetyl-CoA-carboxylase] ligase